MKFAAPQLKATETILLDRTTPIALHDLASVWRVADGAVDIFIARLMTSDAHGSRNHFVRVEAGQFIFPVTGGGLPGDVLFMAVGGGGVKLEKIPLTDLRNSASGDGGAFVAHQIETWIGLTGGRIPVGVFPAQMDTTQDGVSYHIPVAAGLRNDDVVRWIRVNSGKANYASISALEISADAWAPLPPSAWLEALEETDVTVHSTTSLREQGALWDGLEAWQALLVKWSNWSLLQAADDDRARTQAKAAAERGAIERATLSLSALLESELKEVARGKTSDPLLAACMLIGEALKLPIKTPAGFSQARRGRNPLQSIAKASRIRLRRVVLTGDWWKQDGGPLLAFRADGTKPVALLPVSSTSYAIIDPIDGTREDVTAEVAPKLQAVAYTFSRPFPETVITVGKILRFGFYDAKKDVAMIVALGLAGGVLGMLLPLMTGIIFDSIIPSAARNELYYVCGALLVGSLAGVVFGIIRAFALMRLEAKSDAAVQGAVWDRLLSLPLPFFRDYTSGDLADRANGIAAIRQIASDAVLNSVLNGLFSLFSFGLLFYYSPTLAVIATALVLIYVTMSVGVSLYGLRYQRPLFDLQGKIAGQVLQFISGITKLRVAGAEVHAYAVWARAFSQQKQLHLSNARMYNNYGAFTEMFPILTTLCLFVGITTFIREHVSTGMFLAFSAAFTTFLYAMLDFSHGIISLFHALPIYERAKPILITLPEVNEAKADPGDLRGRIEFSRVSFRYKADGPLILKDISFKINPGEFVAIVGPSGSGKSTLLRLILGFDIPESGTILFDGMELSGLDIQIVRKQLGVVLQNGKLMPGDIYQNIVGSSQQPLEVAWEAAKGAGMEEDIRQMPMGMHTVLSEGAGTLSGGQRQRLMIARAIVSKPRILIFDEATSALDNRTQGIVSRSLERLQATRIVIAHRLSTIINADKIIVVKSGSIVQQGTYAELIEQEGPFAELAKRQIA